MLNFLALMGWSMKGDKEIFTLQEMIDNFTFDNISLGGPVFDLEKLAWVNNQHMRMKDLDELASLSRPFYEKYYNLTDLDDDKYKRIIEIIREGSHTLNELAINSEIYFVDEFSLPEITEQMNKKERKSTQKLLGIS